MTEPVPINALPALEPADLAGLMAAFNDVTAKLEATHEQLRAEVARLTRELGEANSQLERSRRLAALGEMAAGIAHEVRNPLGSIRLYARMLEQDLVDRPGEQTVAVKIAGAARVMEGVVSDVLTFAREFRLRPTEIDVGELFDRVLEACCHEGVPGWRGVEVVRSHRHGAVSGLEADPSLLQQALVNLVRNAFEAMADVPGRSHRLILECAGDSEWTTLRIRDTGPGISPEVIARMFNPFFTTRAAGTGLGLAIVHRIIDAHAGQVRVHNNKDGPGATFEVLLPVVASSTEADSREPHTLAGAVSAPETSR
jgi:signal transduction histidine kinase